MYGGSHVGNEIPRGTREHHKARTGHKVYMWLSLLFHGVLMSVKWYLMPENNDMDALLQSKDVDKALLWRRYISGNYYADTMVIYIGARSLTLGCYAVMGLWKNGENLRFIGGYAVCRMIVCMHDIVSAAMYEEDTRN